MEVGIFYLGSFKAMLVTGFPVFVRRGIVNFNLVFKPI